MIRRRLLMILALVFLTGHYALAETSVITLSCDGKMRSGVGKEPGEPIGKLGVVVNFAQNTVTFFEYVVPINSLNATTISFDAQSGQGVFKGHVSGSLDRITGDVVVVVEKASGSLQEWDLSCKPATRLF
jgi:hypothetical protein